MSIGLYVAATWALPLLTEAGTNPQSHPSILITGGGLHDHPFPQYFSLAMQKSAQFNFAGSLSQIASPNGIHVATLDIGGFVSNDDPLLNATNIADHFWTLYTQDRNSWQTVVKIGDMGSLVSVDN